jgi:hypothetical protein
MKKDGQGIGRREFLVMTSSTAIAAAALGQVRLPWSSTGFSSRNFSVGYVDLDTVAQAGRTRPSPNVMSIDRVTSGDGMFIETGVRISVRGYNVMPHSPLGRSDMQLITNYAGRAGNAKTAYPFTAWSYTRGSGAGNLISYNVPVDDGQELSLLFITNVSNPDGAKTGFTRRDVLSAAGGDALEQATDPNALKLTILSGNGSAKLRRGFYVIAPIGGAVTEPDWTRFQVRKSDNGYKLYDLSGFDDNPANFEYLILMLDYASKPEKSKPGRSGTPQQ